MNNLRGGEYAATGISTHWLHSLKALLHYALTHLRFYFSRVSLAFSRVFFSREKREKNVRKIKNASPTRDNVSILHYALGKNASQLRFGRVLVAFWSCFGRVLVTNIAKTQTQRIV